MFLRVVTPVTPELTVGGGMCVCPCVSVSGPGSLFLRGCVECTDLSCKDLGPFERYPTEGVE